MRIKVFTCLGHDVAWLHFPLYRLCYSWFRQALRTMFATHHDFKYSKSCVNGHSKIDTTKFLMTTGSLMKVESIAELGAFCNTF